MSDYPRIFRVRQNFASPSVENIPATVEAELTRLQLDSRVKPDRKSVV